eukprot:TRINITY_DN3735_c0_g2_i1.p1 TRINITY_DN3735_c0_g2~~TRINITY_DN3735_c0_g2_i1.p1  ORF type:complete len:107 (-),score=9.07 TRINITY_DN3735_c0_g2_i1:225-545(-)
MASVMSPKAMEIAAEAASTRQMTIPSPSISPDKMAVMTVFDYLTVLPKEDYKDSLQRPLDLSGSVQITFSRGEAVRIAVVVCGVCARRKGSKLDSTDCSRDPQGMY